MRAKRKTLTFASAEQLFKKIIARASDDLPTAALGKLGLLDLMVRESAAELKAKK